MNNTCNKQLSAVMKRYGLGWFLPQVKKCKTENRGFFFQSVGLRTIFWKSSLFVYQKMLRWPTLCKNKMYFSHPIIADSRIYLTSKHFGGFSDFSYCQCWLHKTINNSKKSQNASSFTKQNTDFCPSVSIFLGLFHLILQKEFISRWPCPGNMFK